MRSLARMASGQQGMAVDSSMETPSMLKASPRLFILQEEHLPLQQGLKKSIYLSEVDQDLESHFREDTVKQAGGQNPAGEQEMQEASAGQNPAPTLLTYTADKGWTKCTTATLPCQVEKREKRVTSERVTSESNMSLFHKIQYASNFLQDHRITEILSWKSVCNL